MPSFEREFMESNGKPITYNSTEIMLMDTLNVGQEFSVLITLLSTNSLWRQGVKIKTDGWLRITNIVNGKSVTGKNHILWEEGLREIPITIEGYSKKGILFIFNAWDTGNSVTQAWHNGAAMKREIKGDDIIYYCNDGHPDENFDDIVFSISIKRGDTIIPPQNLLN